MFEDQPAHLLQALRQPLHELERMKLRLVLQFEGALDGERQRHPVAQLVDEPASVVAKASSSISFTWLSSSANW
jgi:hypothetical protein